MDYARPLLFMKIEKFIQTQLELYPTVIQFTKQQNHFSFIFHTNNIRILITNSIFTNFHLQQIPIKISFIFIPANDSF